MAPPHRRVFVLTERLDPKMPILKAEVKAGLYTEAHAQCADG